MTIEEIVEKYPQAIAPLRDLGVSCIVCGEPIWGTLQENVNLKGLNDLNGIVNKLNDIISNGN
jgi:hypothetical protein